MECRIVDLNFARLYAVCLCVCVLKNTFSLIFPSGSHDRVIDDDDLSQKRIYASAS